MSHEIEIDQDGASMMYVRELPWHGLGQRLDKPATAEQAIKAARLDWKVKKVPVFAHYNDLGGAIKDKFAVIRLDKWKEDDRCALGIVGRAYTPLQNRDAFRFFDPIVGEDAAIYHTAGVLGKGERIWILAKLPGNIRVAGDDITDKYLLLANSHDGSSAVQIKFTPVRVVCCNTLNIALSRGKTFKVRHFSDMHRRLNQAHKLHGIISDRYTVIEEVFKRMVQVQLSTARLDEYLREVFPDPVTLDTEEQHKRADKAAKNRSIAADLFENGAGNKMNGVVGTLWAAYNGIAEMVDHPEGKKKTNGHLKSIWFGKGESIKCRAFDRALMKADAWLN